MEELASKINDFLSIPTKTVFLIMDSCKSHGLLLKLKEVLNNSKIARLSFAGYFFSGNVWKMKALNCPPLGGFLVLAFMNSLAIFKSHTAKHLKTNFESCFNDEANKLFELVTYFLYFSSYIFKHR